MDAICFPSDPSGLPLFLTRVGTHGPGHFSDLKNRAPGSFLSQNEVLLKYMQTLFMRLYVKIPKPTYRDRTEARVAEMVRTRVKVTMPSIPAAPPRVKGAKVGRGPSVSSFFIKSAKFLIVPIAVSPSAPGFGASKIRPEDYPEPYY